MRYRTRWPALAVAGVLALAVPGLGLAAAPSPSAAAATATCNTDAGSYNDFDSDGKADYVVGVPGEDLDGVSDAGRIEIHYGNGTVQGMHMPDPQAGDRFGTSIVSFAIGDGPCDGLLVGAPGHDVDGNDGAGAVAVFWRATDDVTKLAYATTLDQGGLAGTPQAHAGLGRSLAAVPDKDADPADPRTEFYVGAPGYTVNGTVNAGAVVHATMGASTGLVEPSEGTLLTEGSAPVGGTAGTGDTFGTSIGADGRIIGAPGKAVGGQSNAGAAYVRTGDTYRQVTQNTEGVPGSAEAGDQFGAAVFHGLVYTEDTYEVGSPGEALGSATGAGTVTALNDVPAGGDISAHAYYQGKDGIPGTPETGDHFGAVLGADLLMGAPDEDVGTAKDAGAVFQPAHEPGMVQSWSENTDGIPGTAEAGDHFGASLGNDRFRTLVGVPGEDAGAGLVIDGLPRFDKTSVAVHQSSGGVEAGDAFGASLTAQYPL